VAIEARVALSNSKAPAFLRRFRNAVGRGPAQLKFGLLAVKSTAGSSHLSAQLEPVNVEATTDLVMLNTPFVFAFGPTAALVEEVVEGVFGAGCEQSPSGSSPGLARFSSAAAPPKRSKPQPQDLTPRPAPPAVGPPDFRLFPFLRFAAIRCPTSAPFKTELQGSRRPPRPSVTWAHEPELGERPVRGLPRQTVLRRMALPQMAKRGDIGFRWNQPSGSYLSWWTDLDL